MRSPLKLPLSVRVMDAKYLFHSQHATVKRTPMQGEVVESSYAVRSIRLTPPNTALCCRCRAFTIPAPELVGTVALTSDPNVLLACLQRTVVQVDVAAKQFGATVATTPEDHGVESTCASDPCLGYVDLIGTRRVYVCCRVCRI